MSKWNCTKCLAVNPQFSYKCHNCKTDIDESFYVGYASTMSDLLLPVPRTTADVANTQKRIYDSLVNTFYCEMTDIYGKPVEKLGPNIDALLKSLSRSLAEELETIKKIAEGPKIVSMDEVIKDLP